ncbi:MAG: repeat containing protein [Flavipsychrobacter sp.]|nr:repeat containing protein [Flavipsychrobacter sp.]
MKKTYRSSIVLMLIVTASNLLQAQTISTFAGTGVSGSTGDGGSATLARLNTPNGIAVDGAGNVYFTDVNNHKVRKISTSGIITTIAGTGVSGYNGDGIAATAAQLQNPFDLAIDKSGDLYIGDVNANRVRKISGGIISTVAGDGVAAWSGDGGQATAARLSGPGSVMLDGTGNLYIVDGGNHRVRKVNSAGIISTVAGNGMSSYTGDGVPATNAGMRYPGYICMDAAGDLYISDNGTHRIRKVDAAGYIATVAGNGVGAFGGDGGPATAASIHYPSGIAFDATGNLYICDISNQRIRKVSTSGIISTFSGTGVAVSGGDGGPVASASYNDPSDLYFDACNKIYIVEQSANKIRKVAYNNRTPFFSAGPSSTIAVCKNGTDITINGKLTTEDTDLCDPIKWTLIDTCSHGTLSGFGVTASSTGGAISPSGLSYTPTSGYVGKDTFSVKVSDGSISDTMQVYVTITDCALGQPIINAGACPVTVYPNPGNGKINVHLSSTANESATISITNIMGRKVKEFSINPDENKGLILGVPKGLYILSTQVHNEQYTLKLFAE